MSLNIEPNQNLGSGALPPPEVIALADAAIATVAHDARVNSAQQLLFAVSPRSVCEELGLNWWAALKLYEDGWLSFCPEATPKLDESQEAELRFVGALVQAGCDRCMLASLLNGLSKPFAYRLDRLYYDWAARQWKLLPEAHPHPETVFSEWLENLAETGDIGTLSGILELAHDAMARVRHQGVPDASVQP